MPFWNPERQERVRKRIFKIKVILNLLSTILKLVGVAIGGIGLALFLMSVFSFAPTGGFTSLMVWGFGMYLVGYILDKVMATLFGEENEQTRRVNY
jgi:hypothetical protein